MSSKPSDTKSFMTVMQMYDWILCRRKSGSITLEKGTDFVKHFRKPVKLLSIITGQMIAKYRFSMTFNKMISTYTFIYQNVNLLK